MTERRVLPSLLLGDGIAIFLFALLGRAEHESGISLAGIAGTAAPFLVAWYPVGFWLRAFSPDALAGPLAAVRRVALPWLLAWPLGLQLRALILDRSIPFSFALVVFLTNLILLTGWRALYAARWARKQEE